jgi:hypothetical protein
MAFSIDGQLIAQRGLTNPRFAQYGDHGTLTGDRGIEAGTQLAKLVFASDEGRPVQRGAVQAG